MQEQAAQPAMFDRTLRLLVVLAMTVAMLTAVPTTARSHALCGQVDGVAASLASVLRAVNIFESVADTSSATCPDQFAQVQPKFERDFAWPAAQSASDQANNGADPDNPPGRDKDKPCKPNKNRTCEETPPEGACIDGLAVGTFECSGIDMVGHVSMGELGVSFVNDMWGWTDPDTGSDYALVGSSDGMVIVDVTDAASPVVMGILPTASTEGGSSWRDIKVHANHAFVGSEHTDHGIQVFDLTRLRAWDGSYTTFTDDARYTGVGSSHNIAINTDSATLFVVGASGSPIVGCSSGLHMVDISTPTSPTHAGCYDLSGYVHDTQCVIYDGPDTEHQGREICVNSTPGAVGADLGVPSVSIVDVTDKANPVLLADLPYPAGAYSHQGWLTDDQATFFHGDELDENVGTAPSTTTRVFDLSDLDLPVQQASYVADTTSIDHNMYTEGSRMYQSNYTSGLRLLDISDPSNPTEVGFFDMYPENDNASFEGGTWSNYPYFSQPDLVGVSSMDRGLFLLRPTS